MIQLKSISLRILRKLKVFCLFKGLLDIIIIVYWTIRMLNKFGQRPGVQITFWFSSRTPLSTWNQLKKKLSMCFFFYILKSEGYKKNL